MIKPSVGRVVWYHAAANDEIVRSAGEPLAAIVAKVWTDSCVNLAVFDSNGISHNRCSVYLLQDGSERPASAFAEWMPYQKGQAAKTEAAEKTALELGAAARAAGPTSY